MPPRRDIDRKVEPKKRGGITRAGLVGRPRANKGFMPAHHLSQRQSWGGPA